MTEREVKRRRVILAEYERATALVAKMVGEHCGCGACEMATPENLVTAQARTAEIRAWVESAEKELRS